MEGGSLGRYLVAIAAIAAGTVLIIFGDPEKANAWGAVAKQWGPGLVGVLSAAVLWQQRQTHQVLKQQDVKAELRTETLDAVVKKVEKVSEDVNGGSIAALQVKGQEAYARGAHETLESLRPTIMALVAEAVQAERVRGDRAAAEAAAMQEASRQAAAASSQIVAAAETVAAAQAQVSP